MTSPRSFGGGSTHRFFPADGCIFAPDMQRPLLHRLFSFWLVLLVLTSSVGLTVQQHTCQQSGQHTAAVVFSPARHGCPPPRATAHSHQHAGKPRLTSACCKFGTHFHKLDAPSAKITGVQVPAPALGPSWPVAPAWAAAAATPQVPATPRWYATDSSPPRAGRALLTFVGVLVV